MLIKEVESMDNGKLTALAHFLLGRAKDSNVQKTFPLDSFVKLANKMGVAVDSETMRALSQRPPLDSVITNVTNDEIIFKGASVDNLGATPMNTNQAQSIVSRMAKRALPK
jgi:hypothetical protein